MTHTDQRMYLGFQLAVRVQATGADADLVRTFIADLERIKTIPDIEVQIINHFDIVATGADNSFERAEKLANRRTGEPHPWVARDDFDAWIDETVAGARERLAELEQ